MRRAREFYINSRIDLRGGTRRSDKFRERGGARYWSGLAEPWQDVTAAWMPRLNRP